MILKQDFNMNKLEHSFPLYVSHCNPHLFRKQCLENVGILPNCLDSNEHLSNSEECLVALRMQLIHTVQMESSFTPESNEKC